MGNTSKAFGGVIVIIGLCCGIYGIATASPAGGGIGVILVFLGRCISEYEWFG